MLFPRRLLLPLLLTMLSIGCAPPRRYGARPIAPAGAHPGSNRSLADPGLQSFVEANLGRRISSWPPKSWDLRTLSLAALYFNPAIESARARLAEAEAAQVTAGARPNPTLSLAPGVPSPWLFLLDFSVPIETAHKRSHRLAAARSLGEAAQFDLADTAWRVRSAVRVALVNCLLVARSLDLLRAEESLRSARLHLLEQRLNVGEIARPELDRSRIELAQIEIAVAVAESHLAEGRAALAAAVPVPLAALDGIDLAWPELESPPSADSLSPLTIQREAVLNRLDVRRALAQYAAAEAGLQLEIAKQYPDLQLGPGYTYEEGHSFFTTGLAATLPLFNRNQGPIAEAEARRRQAAAAFESRQSQVIAESERSLVRYTAALQEFNEEERALRFLQQTQLRKMQRAVELGEEDRLALNGVEIEQAVLARERLDSLTRAQAALGELEDAVQRPLDPGDDFPAASGSAAPGQTPQPAPREPRP